MGRIAIAGSERGQLFHELRRTCPADVELVALSGPDGQRLDIRDAEAVRRAFEAVQPQALINAAAWTAVDRAEHEPDAARAVNADGAAHLAAAAAAVGAHVVQVSTDFVFGDSDGRPFPTDAPTAPLGVYGQTKLEGEERVRQAAPQAAIIRTAWVYSSHGQNFVKSMLRLMRERDELGVVADQIGSPTWARSLAQACWAAAVQRVSGTLHWSGAGVASWYDFALAIRDESLALGLLQRATPVRPLATHEYPTPAARPAYSVMELGPSGAALGLQPAHWRADLVRMLGELE